MGATTGIAWCDASVNFWIGCTRCGPGCDGCYAAAWAFNKWGIVFEPGGERRPTKVGFTDPLKWNRAHKAGKNPPQRWVFCNSLSDFFDKEAPAELRARAWAVIKQCHHLRWQIVTKRIGLVERYLPDDWNGGAGYEHVGIIGTMVNQEEYDRDIGKLTSLKAIGVKWVGISMEPQLEHIDLKGHGLFIDWIITGGESKQGAHEARMYQAAWADSLIEECERHNVPLFIKQMGDNPYDGTAFHYWPMKLSRGGKAPNEWPARLRVQQMPRIYDNEPARTLV